MSMFTLLCMVHVLIAELFNLRRISPLGSILECGKKSCSTMAPGDAIREG